MVIIAKTKYRKSSDKLSGVYFIVNKVNGHIYIGSSFDIYGRWVHHLYGLTHGIHHSDYLQKAWNKYGKESFEFGILELVKGDLKERFSAEQKWIDYYLDSGVTLYNMCKDVIHTIGCTTTLEALRDGKRSISLPQFKTICYYLIHTDLELCKISEIVKVHPRAVYGIYEGTLYSNMTKDMSFIKRVKKPVKLCEASVIEIINRMMNQEHDEDIAVDYGISTSTIKDIRQRKTWKRLTQDVVFPDVANRRGDKRKPVAQYDISGNLIAEFASAREASKATGVSYKQISRVCNGNRHHTHSFIFKFINKE